PPVLMRQGRGHKQGDTLWQFITKVSTKICNAEGFSMKRVKPMKPTRRVCVKRDSTLVNVRLMCFVITLQRTRWEIFRNITRYCWTKFLMDVMTATQRFALKK